MARLSKAVLADGKVVALPGAATRQPNNHRFADQRRAGYIAKKASPFQARYRSPQQRNADKLAADLNAAGRSPELLILMVMVQAMPADAVANLIEKIAPGVAADVPQAAQALAAIRASRMNVGESMHLMRALAEQSAEGGR